MIETIQFKVLNDGAGDSPAFMLEMPEGRAFSQKLGKLPWKSVSLSN